VVNLKNKYEDASIELDMCSKREKSKTQLILDSWKESCEDVE
jgi:hypothetical protein